MAFISCISCFPDVLYDEHGIMWMGICIWELCIVSFKFGLLIMHH